MLFLDLCGYFWVQHPGFKSTLGEVTQGRAPLLKLGHPSLELVNFDQKTMVSCWIRRFSSQTLEPKKQADECRVYLGDLCITFTTNDFCQLYTVLDLLLVLDVTGRSPLYK